MAEQQAESQNKTEEKREEKVVPETGEIQAQEQKIEEVSKELPKGDDKAEEGKEENKEATPQLSEKELQQMQKVKEENKNPYLAQLNKRIKALGKKIKNIEKIEEQRKSGKELVAAQIEAINNRKVTEKEISHFEELKKTYLQVWEQQKQNDPVKIMFQLVHGITVELKVGNQKFAAQTERLNKFRLLLFTEPATFMDFPSATNNSNSLFQKFLDSSEEIAFEEVTFKQLKADLQEINAGINGFIQFKLHEQEKKKKQEQRQKEKEEKKKEDTSKTKPAEPYKEKDQPVLVGVDVDKKEGDKKKRKKTNKKKEPNNNHQPKYLQQDQQKLIYNHLSI